jgi:hypothetical protein
MGSSALRELFPGTFAVHAQGGSATFVAYRGGALTGSSFFSNDKGRWSVKNG